MPKLLLSEVAFDFDKAGRLIGTHLTRLLSAQEKAQEHWSESWGFAAHRWVSLRSTHPTQKQRVVGWVEERNPSIRGESDGGSEVLGREIRPIWPAAPLRGSWWRHSCLTTT
jgi:hypothetical protein